MDIATEKRSLNQWRRSFRHVRPSPGASPNVGLFGQKLYVLADIEPYHPDDTRTRSDIERVLAGADLHEITMLRRLDEHRRASTSITYLAGVTRTHPRSYEVLLPHLTADEAEGIRGVAEEVACRRAIKTSDLPEHEKASLLAALPDRRAIGTNTVFDTHLAVGRREVAAQERRLAKEAARNREEKERLNSKEWLDEQLALAREEAEERLRRRFVPEGCPYRTLRAAFKDVWVEERAHHYGGETLALKGHDLTRNAKRAMSRTEWSKIGYQVLCEAEYHAILSGQWTEYPVYREDQVAKCSTLKIQKRHVFLKSD